MTYHQEGKSRKPVERRESSRLQSAAKLLRSKKNIELSQSKKKEEEKRLDLYWSLLKQYFTYTLPPGLSKSKDLQKDVSSSSSNGRNESKLASPPER